MRYSARSIQGVLVRRIGLTALAVGAGVALAAFFLERGRVGDLVIDRALVGAARLSAQLSLALDAPGPLDPAAIQRAMDAIRTASPDRARFGQFVMAAVFDPDGKPLGELVDDEHPPLPEIRSRMGRADHRLSGSDYRDAKFVRVQGQPHVHVAIPLTSSSGKVVAHLEGVFAVSSAGVSLMRRRVATSVGAAVLIVLLTTMAVFPIIAALTRRLGRMTMTLLDANLDTLKVLGGAVAKRDTDTDAHNFRVAIYSVRLAETLGLPAQQIRALIKGAFVHDVGKIAIPDAVLLKPGKLDDAEFEVMKSHVEHGQDLTSHSSWLSDGVDVVGCHHEKYDGSGYPRGIKDDAIPSNARIFAIADVFDALASRRPYKEPCSFEQTMEILEQGRGIHFDPELLDVFAGIAAELHTEFAGDEGEKPRLELAAITQRYFRDAVAEMI